MHPQQPQSNVIMGGEGSFVQGESLKKVDVPVETVWGMVNGAIRGTMLSSVASAAITYFNKEGAQEKVGSQIIENISTMSKHGKYVAGVTAGLAAMGALMSYSRSSNHNEWSDKHYQLLEKQMTSHAEQVTDSRAANATSTQR